MNVKEMNLKLMEIPDVDFSLTTRELAELIKQFNIDFNSLDEEDFDMPPWHQQELL